MFVYEALEQFRGRPQPDRGDRVVPHHGVRGAGNPRRLAAARTPPRPVEHHRRREPGPCWPSSSAASTRSGRRCTVTMTNGPATGRGPADRRSPPGRGRRAGRGVPVAALTATGGGNAAGSAAGNWAPTSRRVNHGPAPTRNMTHPSRSHQGWEDQGAHPAAQTRTPHRCMAHRGDLRRDANAQTSS